MSPFDGLDQQAGFGFAFDDGFAGFPAFQDTFTGIQAEITECAAGVAGMAMGRKKRANLRFEEFVSVGGKQRKGASDQRHEWAWHIRLFYLKIFFLQLGVLRVIIHM